MKSKSICPLFDELLVSRIFLLCVSHADATPTSPNLNIFYIIMDDRAILGSLYILNFVLFVYHHYVQTMGIMDQGLVEADLPPPACASIPEASTKSAAAVDHFRVCCLQRWQCKLRSFILRGSFTCSCIEHVLLLGHSEECVYPQSRRS